MKTRINKCITQLNEEGSVLLLPTETVYGLMCLWSDDIARNKIYKIKQRDTKKPFQMLISNIEMLKSYNVILCDKAKQIIEEFCPGPITIILSTTGGDTIGFRMPQHKFMLNLIQKLNKPLAATSANISGEQPILTVNEATASFAENQPDLIIDDGPIKNTAKASTVIQIINNEIKVLREGIISLEMILSTVKI